jgi:type IV pilus assembly protein PilC
MAQFSYLAVNKAGERVKGTIDAPSEAEVRVMLRSQSLRPVKIDKPGALEVDLVKLGGIFSGRPKDTDVLIFTRQLSILISSGVPLLQGLEIIAAQIESPAMKETILALREKISGGSFLWEALKPYEKTFSEIYINMIRAGEAAGALDTILQRLIQYLDDAYKLKKLVKGAMIYPIAITIVGIVVVIVMMVYVIPKFEDLLKGAGQELPAPTQFVIDASHFIQHNLIYMMGIGAALTVIIKKYLGTEEGRTFFDHYVLKVPLFGAILLKVGVARFARTLQTLLTSGINLLDAMDITKDAVGNKTISATMAQMKSEVEQGKTLAGVMAKMPIFPNMVTQMVTVGESTGNLDKMLERVADFYEEEVRDMVGNMTKMIEPFVLVFLGGMVGGLLIAMYLPIFKMAGGV